MATKLKKMRLTSVDLVKAGANQKADIRLYKSADDPAQEAPDAPTEEEKNIFKRFLSWMHETLTDFDYEPENPIEKSDEPEPEPADIYKSAITESLQSIMADETLSAEEKNEMIEKSIEQYHEAMLDLVYNDAPEEDEAPEEEEGIPEEESDAPDFDTIEEI